MPALGGMNSDEAGVENELSSSAYNSDHLLPLSGQEALHKELQLGSGRGRGANICVCLWLGLGLAFSFQANSSFFFGNSKK